jgi:hypothetical protein
VFLDHAELAHDAQRRLEEAVVHRVEGAAAAVLDRDHPKEGSVGFDFGEHRVEGRHAPEVRCGGRLP